MLCTKMLTASQRRPRGHSVRVQSSVRCQPPLTLDLLYRHRIRRIIAQSQVKCKTKSWCFSKELTAEDPCLTSSDDAVDTAPKNGKRERARHAAPGLKRVANTRLEG